MGGLKTVMKVSQDAPDLLDQGGLTSDRPLNALIPIFIKFFAHPRPAVKQIALQSLTAYVKLFPAALATNMNEVMQGLSSIASDPDDRTRKRVCEALLTLFEYRSEYLEGQLPSICEFMIVASGDKHPPTSMKATEVRKWRGKPEANHAAQTPPNNNFRASLVAASSQFWNSFFHPDAAVSSELREEIIHKQNVVPRLVPTLLKNVVYNEEERANILYKDTEDEALAAAGTTRAMDAPVHHKNKGDDDEDDDDEGFDDGEDSSWSIRKCSAGTLESIACSSLDPRILLGALLPALQLSLASPDPWLREGAILALGSVVVRGCGQAIESEHFAQLYPFLISQLSDSLPIVAATSAWTLARYCGWVVYQTESNVQPGLLASHIELLVNACNSVNTKVQNAALTSFSAVVEVAGASITPLLPQIYQFLAAALSRFGGKVLLTLYDTFGILADTFGEAIGANGMADSWVPQLLEKWRMLHEQSRSAEFSGDDAQALLRRQLLPLLECIACSAVALGVNYQPYALMTLDRALEAIDSNTLRVVTLRHTNDRQAVDEEEDSEVIICALDVIDGLVEGLQQNFSGLLSASSKREQFLPMLNASCLFDVGGVRMSGLALLGDLCMNAPNVISSTFDDFVKVIIINMNNRKWAKVVNNALWSFGELCNQCIGKPQGLLPYQDKLWTSLLPLVLSQQVGIVENAAAAMGRLCRVDGKGFGAEQAVQGNVEVWLGGIGQIVDRAEKSDAMEGLILAVMNCPALLLNEATRRSSVTAFLMCVASFHVRLEEGCDFRPLEHEDCHHATYTFLPWPADLPKLGAMVKNCMNAVMANMPGGAEEANKCIAAVPLNVRKLLQSSYG